MAELGRAKRTGDEIRQLFVELKQAYARLAETIPSEFSAADAGAAARFMEEANRVSSLIRRIREYQGL